MKGRTVSEQGKRERDRAAKLSAKLQSIKDPVARLKEMEQAAVRVVNKAPEWPYWNRVATVTQHEAICLTLSLDPRSYYSNDTNSQRYREIYAIVGSHIANFSLRYHNRNIKTFRVIDWLLWLQKIDIPIPEGWRPIGLGLKLDNQPVVNGGPCWTEAVSAAIEMRGNPKIRTPINQERLYEYMLESENKERFHNCCNGLVDWQAVKARVYRERKDNNEAIKNPLKDTQFLNMS